MVTLRYPIADLTRRRHWTLASLACFIVTTASQTCLSLTGFTLGLDLTLFTGRAPIGLHILFSRLVMFLTLIGIAVNVVIFAGMSLAQTAGRRRDMAVMKALGSVGEVNSFFLGEIFLTSGVGVPSGIGLGVAIYTVLGIVVGPVFGPWSTPSLWILVCLTITSVLLAFLSSCIPLWWIVERIDVVSALSGQTWVKGLKAEALFRRFGLTIRFALRDASTRRSETLTTFLLTTLSVSLLSVLLFGGHTALYTTRSYIQRGVDEQVFLIATPVMAEAYTERLSFTGTVRSRDFLASSNEMPPEFLTWLLERPDVVVDARLVAETIAFEVAFVEALPGPSYRIVGDERSKDVLVVGLQPDNAVGDWVTWGRRLSKGDGMKAVVGDALLDIFTSWSLERVSLWGRAFPIVGVVMDPLNMGKTVYVPYDPLKSILGVEGPNVVLIRARDPPYDFPETVGKEASRYGLTMVGLDEVVSANILSMGRLWMSVSWTVSLGLSATTLGLASYLVAMVQTRADDLKVILVVGSSWKRIIRFIWAENALVVIPAVLLGANLGALFSFYFLILSPQIPPLQTLMMDALIISVSLGVMSLASVKAASVYLRKALGRR